MGRQEGRWASLPIFDRKFFEGRTPFTQIGRGALGGKASGLVFIKDILAAEIDAGAFGGMVAAVPTMTVIATDLFDEFVTLNKLDGLPFEEMTDDRIAHAFQQADLPMELVGDMRALISQVHSPLAVRSSSMLEDALHRPFAGVYATKMIPNNQLDPDSRFRRLVEAVKFVYASTFFREARDYVRAAERDPAEEKMAVIIQEVVGRRHGDRFYPDVSGVARSYNFYPMPPAHPGDGIVNLALGLGKTIVDGGVCWTYSPAHPARTPPFADPRACVRETQTEFWAVNMGKPPAYDPVNEVEYLVRADLIAAEKDEVLRFVASTYDVAADRLTMGIGAQGPRVLTFAPLLVLEQFPLNELIKALLRASEEASQAKVEIEFALSFDEPRGAPATARLGFLQVRPMVVSETMVDVRPEDLADPRALVASDRVMGNGVDDTMQDIVYVRPDRFESRHTTTIAAEVDTINRGLIASGQRCVLIGFGRWGSSDPCLGIPVKWVQISSARAIVETTLPAINVEPSQGAHFFHNMSSFRVSYFTVHHEGRFPIDWGWLARQPVVAETEFVRHVRAAVPLSVRVDGRTGRGVILHEG